MLKRLRLQLNQWLSNLTSAKNLDKQWKQIKSRLGDLQRRYTLSLLFVLFLVFGVYLIYYQYRVDPLKNRRLVEYIVQNLENLEGKTTSLIEKQRQTQELDLQALQELIQTSQTIRKNIPFVYHSTEMRVIGETFDKMLADWEIYLASNLLIDLRYRQNIQTLSYKIVQLLQESQKVTKLEKTTLEEILNLTKEIRKHREARLKTQKQIFEQNHILVWMDEEDKKIGALASILNNWDSQTVDSQALLKQVLDLYNQKYLDSFSIKLERSDFYTKDYQQTKEFLSNRILEFLQQEGKKI